MIEAIRVKDPNLAIVLEALGAHMEDGKLVLPPGVQVRGSYATHGGKRFDGLLQEGHQAEDCAAKSRGSASDDS